MRNATRRTALRRRTRGTEVEVELKLDGAGRSEVQSPFELLSVLLEMLAGHGRMDLRLTQKINHHANDDYAVDDLAMALAEAMNRCLGPRPRIRQFGCETLPVGDALVMVAVDLVSPPYFDLHANFNGSQIDGFGVDLLQRFLLKFVDRLGASLHVQVIAGRHDVNIARAIFLALGRALAHACEPVDREGAREVAANIDYLELGDESGATSAAGNGGREVDEFEEVVAAGDGAGTDEAAPEREVDDRQEIADADADLTADGSRVRRRRGRRGGRGRRRTEPATGPGRAAASRDRERARPEGGGDAIDELSHEDTVVDTLAPLVEDDEAGVAQRDRERAAPSPASPAGRDTAAAPPLAGERRGRRGLRGSRGRRRRTGAEMVDEKRPASASEHSPGPEPEEPAIPVRAATGGDRPAARGGRGRMAGDSPPRPRGHRDDDLHDAGPPAGSGNGAGDAVLDFVTSKEPATAAARPPARAKRGRRRIARTPRRRR